MKYTWINEATLEQAVDFMQGKTLAKHKEKPIGCDSVATVIFTDGSIVEAESRCSGPYSEVTPDIDMEPPVFRLGTPIK